MPSLNHYNTLFFLIILKTVVWWVFNVMFVVKCKFNAVTKHCIKLFFPFAWLVVYFVILGSFSE